MRRRPLLRPRFRHLRREKSGGAELSPGEQHAVRVQGRLRRERRLPRLLLVGLIESYTTQYLDPGLIDIVVFGLLLLMLAFRPTGLVSERREENV